MCIDIDLESMSKLSAIAIGRWPIRHVGTIWHDFSLEWTISCLPCPEFRYALGEAFGHCLAPKCA